MAQEVIEGTDRDGEAKQKRRPLQLGYEAYSVDIPLKGQENAESTGPLWTHQRAQQLTNPEARFKQCLQSRSQSGSTSRNPSPPAIPARRSSDRSSLPAQQLQRVGVLQPFTAKLCLPSPRTFQRWANEECKQYNRQAFYMLLLAVQSHHPAHQQRRTQASSQARLSAGGLA
ncbi:unnamed protein product [Arctogadus glacialis]